jgi:hypothetical protein
VTLKDDTKHVGLLGAKSFISTDPSERDIYIEKVYERQGDGEWKDVGDWSVLIAGSEVKTVEFKPYWKEERDEQRN